MRGAQVTGWVCPGCCKPGVPEVVQLRGEDRVFRDSTIMRCPRDECYHSFGGTIADRLAHVQRVYGYKYFGDYPLDPEQMDAVGTMLGMAALVPELLEALKAVLALDEATGGEVLTAALEEQCRAAILKAEPSPPRQLEGE